MRSIHVEVDPPKRRRRSAEEAHAAILEAAEQLLKSEGPGALRLQEVARLAGISHPTLLHHFGSREGLIDALNRKTASEIADFLESFDAATAGPQPDRIGAVFDKFRDGLAQRLVWLTLSGASAGDARRPNIDRIVDAMTRIRTDAARRNGLPAPSREDVAFVFHLVLVTSVGEALVGDAFPPVPRTEDRDRRRTDFVERFKRLLRRI